MRSLIVAVALVALFPLTTSAQSIEGAWERVDITFEGGPNPRTLEGQGFVIFMDGHFIVLEVNGLTRWTTAGVGRLPNRCRDRCSGKTLRGGRRNL